MSTDNKPLLTAPTPELALVMGLVMPILQGFLSEIATLPPAEQTRRVQKILVAMRADA